MIRRVCAKELGAFAAQLENQYIITDIIPIFNELSQDDQDTIRVSCLESLIPMAKMLSTQENM